MTRYLISFDGLAMQHIPDEEMPAVGEAAHAVLQEAVSAGVWVFGAGLQRRSTIVAADGTISEGRSPRREDVVGGFAIVDVPSREDALAWARKIAVACRCAQEVWELMPDPEQEAMVQRANAR